MTRIDRSQMINTVIPIGDNRYLYENDYLFTNIFLLINQSDDAIDLLMTKDHLFDLRFVINCFYYCFKVIDDKTIFKLVFLNNHIFILSTFNF